MYENENDELTNQTTNEHQNNTYESGNYTSYNNSGNYSNYNNNYAGYNNQGNYAGSNPGGYGTYQYGNYQQPVGPGMNNVPKKTSAGKKAAIAVAIILVISLGLGGAYYSFTRILNNTNMVASSGDRTEDIQEADEDDGDLDSAEDEETTAEITDDGDAAQAQTEDFSNDEAGISQTQVVDPSEAVVTDVTKVVAAAMPAMVSINNNYTQSASFFGQQYSEQLTASGSGIIVGSNETELLIATNHHVIEGADTLEVQFADESKAGAEVKGTNSEMDLAVIAVQLADLEPGTKSAIAIATLGDSDTLVLGEPAIAIGNALGYGQSVTTGVISAVNRTIEVDSDSTGTFIQTNAEINPGNSGGALLNIKGQVIGINSNKIGGSTVEGMGYAIPISIAKPIIEKLMQEETKVKVSDEEKGYLGISGVSVTSDVSQMYGIPQGVYIANVTSGGGAEAAGLKEGDIIVEFEGYEISSMEDLKNRLEYYAKGSTVNVKIMRQAEGGYAEQEIQITLGDSSTLGDSNNTEGDKYDGQPNSDALPREEDGSQEMNPDGNTLPDDFGFGFDFGN
ncbi:MAG: trypsin-like peptidase domain-containing protein [Butyrivibrio sp.]|nr:trypsin-like peptidase domain-containing protein [Butyrivibrio sp.]